MKKRFFYRQGSATLSVVALLVLVTGCSGDDPAQMDLSTPEQIRATVLDCDTAKKARNILEDASPGALSENGLPDPEDEVAIESSINAVEGQILEFCSDEESTPEATDSPSATETTSSEPEATATTTPEVTVAATPTATKTVTVTAPPPISLEVKTWGQLLEVAAYELEDIDGLSVKSTKEWAALRGADGNPFDARIVIVTESDLDDSDARKQAGVGDEVPVLHASDCELSNDEPCPTGALVIYSPLKEVDDGRVAFDLGTGVLFTENDVTDLISYTR